MHRVRFIMRLGVIILNIFMPPVVDPVQPPINIIIKNNAVENDPQLEKLAVVYPVPVITDTPLNKASLKDVKKAILLAKQFHKVRARVNKRINNKKIIT